VSRIIVDNHGLGRTPSPGSLHSPPSVAMATEGIVKSYEGQDTSGWWPTSQRGYLPGSGSKRPRRESRFEISKSRVSDTRDF